MTDQGGALINDGSFKPYTMLLLICLVNFRYHNVIVLFTFRIIPIKVIKFY